MTDVKFASHRKNPWLKRLAIIFGVLAVLLVVAWFTVTSTAFFKGVILPRVGKAMNADITVSSASISPFSKIVLQNLKVQTTGAEPLLMAGEVRAQYHLFSILRGNIAVDEITLESPSVNLIVAADGTSNLDPLLKSSASKETKPTAPAKSGAGKPLRIDLKKLALNHATIRQTQNFKDGSRNVMEVSEVNVTLDDLRNGATGKLQLSAATSLDNQSPAAANMQMKIAGDFDFTPDADFTTVTVKGGAHFDVTQAGGTMKDFSGFGGDLDCDVTPMNIGQVALRFRKSGESLGELRASGPLDMKKSEGRLNVEILALDRRVLNFFGASSGIDFGGTTINSTNRIELTKAGAVIAANGQLVIANLQLLRAGQKTPVLDAEVNYDLQIDRAAQAVSLRALNFSATQNHQPLMRAELSQTMNLSWNGANQSAGDSAFNVNVTGMNLADWKPFLGENVGGGNFSLESKLLSHSGGKQIEFNLKSQIADLTANFGSNEVRQAQLTLAANGSVTEFKQFKLDNFLADVSQQNQTVLMISGSGASDLSTQTANFEIRLQATLPELAKLSPQSGANLSSGAVEATATISQKGETQTITGKLSLTSLTGKFGNDLFQNYAAAADFSVIKNSVQLQSVHAKGNLNNNGQSGGNFDVSMNYDDKKDIDVIAKLDGFNENGLRPFFEPLLADKKLVSIAVNGNVSAKVDAQNSADVKADLQLTNLVVRDPAGKFPATALEAKLQLDAVQKKQIAKLNRLQVTLTPTDRAKNELQLSGSVDLSQPDVMTGSLKLDADALDMTRYYDLFGAKQKPAIAATTPEPAPPINAAPVANANREPDAMHLPFGTFTVDATVGHFYLREVEASDFTTTVKIAGSHVVLSPCKFTLNGAPVSATADLNLGVPGYEYNLVFNANRVPIAPLVNSFSVDYKYKAQGDLFANFDLKGAGVTGQNLKKTLAGNADIVLTNAIININAKNSSTGWFNKSIGYVITGLSTVLQLNELRTSPLTGMEAHAKMGGGKITATEISAGSAAFQAQTAGTITIANVLTNSTIDNWPVHLALARKSAQSLVLVPPNAPANQTYFPLPDFMTLIGTIGKLETKRDNVALAAILGRTGLNVAGKFTGKGSTNTVQVIENVLNSKAAEKVFDFFKKK